MKRPRLRDAARLLHLSARMIVGRRYWIAPLIPLAWIAFQVFRLLVGWRPQDYTPADAQVILIGFPLTVLAVGLGVRIIAGEIDRRTLEIAYTVPGGAQRAWLAKLAAAVLILIAAEIPLAITTWVFCTAFPLGVLYGAFQAAVFYLVLSMAMAALFKSEAAGALATIVVMILNLVVHGAGARISPFWNPEALQNADPLEIVAWTTQNRIGFVLVTAAILALAFGRAEQRERMLGN